MSDSLSSLKKYNNLDKIFSKTIVFGKNSDIPKSSFFSGFWNGNSSRNLFQNQSFKNPVSMRDKAWILKLPSVLLFH